MHHVKLRVLDMAVHEERESVAAQGLSPAAGKKTDIRPVQFALT